MTADDLDERLAVYLRGGWGRAQRADDRGECEWYALRTASQREHVAAAGLAERGFTFFLPMQTDWHGKPKVRHMTPLLAGYVFALCGTSDFADLHGLEGVQGLVRCVRDDGSLSPVVFPALVILGLQADERAGAFDYTRLVKPPRYQPRKGEMVRIKAGPYYDFLAKVLAAPSGQRCKLLIEGPFAPRKKTLDVAHLAAA